MENRTKSLKKSKMRGTVYIEMKSVLLHFDDAFKSVSWLDRAGTNVMRRLSQFM